MIYGHCSLFCVMTVPTLNLAVISVTAVQAETSSWPLFCQDKQAQHVQSLHFIPVLLTWIIPAPSTSPPADSPHCSRTGGAKTGHSITSPIYLSLSSLTARSLLCSITAFFLARLVHRGVWELLVPVQISIREGLRTSALFLL